VANGGDPIGRLRNGGGGSLYVPKSEFPTLLRIIVKSKSLCAEERTEALEV